MADADGFNDHHVVAGRFADQHGFTGFLGHAAQGAAGRAGADIGLFTHRQLIHARLVAQNGAARNGGRRVNRQHSDAMPLGNEVKPQHFNKSGLAHARHAADAQAQRLAGVRQQRRQQFIGLHAVVSAR